MNHYRKTMQKYKSRQRSTGCPFCDSGTIADAVYQSDLLYVVPNLTKYDLWELHDVEDHLLIIPKRHVDTLADLDQEERLEIINKIAEFESLGYSIYARGVKFAKRSVKHQHTHLIKTTNKKPRLALFIQSPYFLLKK